MSGAAGKPKKETVADPTPPAASVLAALDGARERALRDWFARAKDRELPRLGISANGSGREWLKECGIPEGEWLAAAKDQFRAGMRPNCGALKERVWNCLMLQSAGFQGELAIRLMNNRYVAFSASDLRRELNRAAEEWAASLGWNFTDEQKKKLLHVSKAHVRRALAGLEEEGRALRCRKDGILLRDLPAEDKNGLLERDVLLFCPLRPPFPEAGRGSHIWLPRFAPSSPFSVASLNLKQLRLRGFDPAEVAGNDYLLGELTGAVETYKTAATVAREAAQTRVRVAAQREHIRNKELRNKDLKVSEWKEDSMATQNHSPTPPPKASLLRQTLEERFGPFRPGDPIADEWDGLAGELGIPEKSLIRVVQAKLAEKDRIGYPIEGAKALLGFLRPMLPSWIKRFGDRIERDRRDDTGQPGRVDQPMDGPPPFTPLTRDEQILSDCSFVREFPKNVSVPGMLQKLKEALEEPDLSIDVREAINSVLAVVGAQKAGQA